MPRRKDPNAVVHVSVRLEPDSIKRATALSTETWKLNAVLRECVKRGLDSIEKEQERKRKRAARKGTL
jgi:3-isopropylmalate dehydratase small subunit